MTSKTIANYKILKELGTGGMGTVFLAENISIGNKVAIKMLHPHLVKSEDLKTRFLKEARTQAILDHPNITKVINFVSNDQGLFIILEFVEGEPLNDFLFKTKGLLPEKEANHYMTKIVDAVGYAHSKGIVHRDLKSANIMVTPNKGIKIMDFGIAKLTNDSMSLTKTGSRMGSPLYMSPEQVTHGTVDFRSDIYSLGVVYHEMLTGTPVYDQTTTTEFEIYNRIVKQPLPRLKEFYKMNSDQAQEIVDTATAKLPQARFQDCMEFKRALSYPNEAPKERARHSVKKSKNNNIVLRWTLGIIVLLIIASGSGFYYYNGVSNKNEVLEKAEGYYDQKQYKKALKAFKIVLSKNPNDQNAENKIQEIEFKSSKYESEAVQTILNQAFSVNTLMDYPTQDTLPEQFFLKNYSGVKSKLNVLKANDEISTNPKFIQEELKHLENLSTYYRAKQLLDQTKVNEAKALLDNDKLIQTGYIIALKNEIPGYLNPILFDFVETPPVFPGCNQKTNVSLKSCFKRKINDYLQNNLNLKLYNTLVEEAGNYQIYYTFTLLNTGSLTDIKINAFDPAVAKDIENILLNLREIKPATKNGLNVSMTYNGVLNLKLGNAKPTKEENQPIITKKKTDKKESEEEEINIPTFISLELADSAPVFPSCEDKTGFQLYLCTKDKINNFLAESIKSINNEMVREKLLSEPQKATILLRIDKEGYLESVSVNTPMPRIENTIIRTVEEGLPKMKPAYYKGHPIGIEYQVSLTIKE